MIELLVIGATLLVAAGASGAQAHRRTRAARALSHYAQTRELKFIPAPRKPRGAGPRVEGTKDEIAFTVDFYRLGGNLRSRVSAATKGRSPKLAVAQRSAFSRTFGANELPAIPSGDEAFDKAFRVTCNAAEDIEAIGIDTRKNLLLLNQRSDVWLEATGTKVVLSWAGIEVSPMFFDAARDAACAIAAAQRSDFPYR